MDREYFMIFEENPGETGESQRLLFLKGIA